MNAPIFKRHAALHPRPRSWMPASTTKAPLPNRCIPVAAFSKSTDALGIVPPTPKLTVFMHHLQRTRTPSANFWAVSQGEPARSATTRRRFPKSEKLTANNSRRKPHRSPGPWRNRRPFPAKPLRSRRGATTGKAAAAVSTNTGRASDIAGSCPQARPQQPPAPTANETPAATWAHPCSKSSHIGG